jgi:hypothetical protein
LVVANDYGSFGTTSYGSQYLVLTATSDSVSQVIDSFIAGENYVLTADYADLRGSPGRTFTLAISGAAVDSQTFSATGAGNYGAGAIPFQMAALFFTANSNGAATITLSDNAVDSNPGQNQVAVDNVSLSENAPSAPEPAASMETLIGLCSLAGLIRLRSRISL